jgi:peptidylprolyl isomerase
MRLKSLIAAAALLMFAGNATAQRPQVLPTSKKEVQTAPQQNVAVLTTPALEPENTLHLDLSTGGRVSVQLRPDAAPNHVERIKALTRQGFYNGLVFHRVIEGFMAQGGDPKGDGTGGSPLPDLAAEFNPLPHVRGVLSAARADDPNSANSQFFIMLAPRLSLDRKYTAFGRVVSGMEFVDRIERGEPPANPTRIVRASIGSDNVPPLSQAELTAPAPVTAPSAPPAAALLAPPAAAGSAAPAPAVPPQAQSQAGAPPQ